jgi:uncharacterized DUF497 family protein
MIACDPVKEAENLKKHGLPLVAAEFLFDSPFIEEEDGRANYGETRFIATGPVAQLGNRVCFAIYTWRGGIRRVISFRKANDREVRKYQASDPGRG